MSWSNKPDPLAEAEWATPVRVEILAGKLAAWIYGHGIESRHGRIPCWSYITEGLTGGQQTEVVFTLRRDPEDPSDDAPEEPLRLLATIHQATQAGQRVTSGSFTELGDAGFFGHHVLYVRGPSLPGVRLPASCLAALLVTSDELRAVREFGSTRVLARLGQASSHYPFPPWADLRRLGLSLEHTLEASVLSKVPRASAHDVYVAVNGNQITATALRSARLSWNERLAQVPEGVSLALLTAFDPEANACLVWVPGQSEPEAIVPPGPLGSDGTRVCGCFLMFLDGQAEDGGEILEDGVAMELTRASWQAVRQALIDGKELSIPATAGGMSFALTWRDEVDASPIDVGAYRAERGTHQAASRASIRHVRVLTSQEELAARTSVVELVEFCEDIRRSAQQVLGDRGEEAELLIGLQCTPEGHGIKLAGHGEVPQEVMGAFFETIKQLPSLPVQGGEVSFEIELAVAGTRGGAAE